MKKLLPVILVSLFTLQVFTGCDDPEDEIGTPRPRGYFRIALPEKNYALWDDSCPFTFEIPDYSHIYHSAAPNAEKYWRDMYFGPFKATLYLSYKEVTGDSMLEKLVNESWQLTEAHSQVAGGLLDSMILNPKDHVYGTVENLSGNAATLLQFYVTDSTHNFLRGSLYFYAPPNKDSIAPVIDFLRKDVYHMLWTLKWKDHSGVIIGSGADPNPTANELELFDNTSTNVREQLSKSDYLNPDQSISEKNWKKIQVYMLLHGLRYPMLSSARDGNS